MYCIYGKNKVGQAVATLCDFLHLSYEMVDDADNISSFEKYEAIIPSPGVPGTHQIYKSGKVIAELDFAFQYLPNGFKIVSITGTDGKSTTAWITYNILQKEFSGKKSIYISGNFDIPFSATVLDILQKGEKRGFIVLEVSSFMTHAIREFTSDYTIFTNLKSDHLNWHRDLEEYLDAKMHLVEHTTKTSVINREVLEFASEKKLKLDLPENVRIFGTSETQKDRTDGENIIISGHKKYKLSETRLTGFHNAMNLLSVGILANELGICSKRVKQYFAQISGLPHRLEKIGEKNGIIFVEDSKSTSAQSLEAALGSYVPVKNEKWKISTPRTKNLLLIVGGSDKGDAFDHLAMKFQERVKAMMCIGATKEHFVAIARQENIPYLATDSLKDGIGWLYEQGSAGDVLMLSPGCASFGLFRDYLDRANQFREIIKNLP